VSIVGLAAQVAICAELCARTNAPFSNNQPGPISTTATATNYYSVALHEQHFRELFLAATTPPPTPAPPPTTTTNTSAGIATNASLLMMGFPSRALAAKDGVSLCACHHRPSREGYACTRCAAKVCRLPADCPVCGLTLILSTHLARSYHHLFPLRVWVEVGWAEAAARVKAAGGPAGAGSCCFACLVRFPEVPQRFLTGSGAAASTGGAAGKGLKAGGKGEKGAAGGEAAGGGAGGVDGAAAAVVKGVSESGRYKCQVCGNHFCIDCDVFAHEIIHNCPGCQSDTRGPAERNGEANGQPDNGTGEAMAVDS
jgi:transcription initiation factor TFIIH subunit 2